VGVVLDTEKFYEGVVKEFNMQAGRGFIDCDEIRELTGQSVYLHYNVLSRGGATVGDPRVDRNVGLLSRAAEAGGVRSERWLD